LKRICLGKITGAHGIKGLVKIYPFGDDPTLIGEIVPLYTKPDGDETITLTLQGPQGSHFLARVEGVADRTQAETMKGTELYVPREALPAIEDDGEFYIEDLIGMETRDEAGNPVGTVLAVHNFGAGDILEIRLKTGKDVMIPLTPDFVPDIGEILIIRRYEDFL
jgi:16S rRNA processing protein RimM